jgi:hypothetical protein
VKLDPEEQVIASALEAIVKIAVGHDLMFSPKGRELDASDFDGAALIRLSHADQRSPKD